MESAHEGKLLPLPWQWISVVQELAQWRNPVLKLRVEAPQSSVVENADGAIPAWVADECNRALRQELSPDAEEMHAYLVH